MLICQANVKYQMQSYKVQSWMLCPLIIINNIDEDIERSFIRFADDPKLIGITSALKKIQVILRC